MTGKRIAIFLGLTFVITFIYEIFVVGRLVFLPEVAPYATLLVGSVMLIPAICVVLTRIITKEGFRDAWILPNFKGHIKYYIIAWLAPMVLIGLGALLYFVAYPAQFDLNMGYLAQTYAATGLEFDADAQKAMMLMSILQGVLLAPILNIITTTGEEWGWRGYLVPKLLEKMPVVPMLLVSGVIWGLWHAPLTIIIGHNYGMDYAGYPYLGIAAMCLFCIAMGTLFSYVSLKTRSCLPASIAHGALNGMAAIGIYFLPTLEANQPFIGPAPTGVIGGAGFVIVMVVLAVMMVRDHKKGILIAPPRAPKEAQTADTAA